MKAIYIILVLSLSILADSRPIFIMVYDKNCEACMNTINLISKDTKLSEAIINYTKPFQMTKEEAAANNLLVRMVPTFFILDPNTNQMLVKPLEGAIDNPRDFERYLIQIYETFNNQLQGAVESISKKYKIQNAILLALVDIESKFKPLAISVVTEKVDYFQNLDKKKYKVLIGGKAFHHDKSIVSIYPNNLDNAKSIAFDLKKNNFSFAVGLGQINTTNFSKKEIENIFDPVYNLNKSITVLQDCSKQYDDIIHIVECYNRGGKNLSKMLKKKIYYFPYYARFYKSYKKYKLDQDL